MRPHPTPVADPRSSDRFMLVPTVAIGVAASISLLRMFETAATRPLDCLDPLRCAALGDLDFLRDWTAGMRSPRRLQEESFHLLAEVGVTLTVLLVLITAVNVATRLGATSVKRRREFALRSVLGVSPWRILIAVAGESAARAGTALLIGLAAGAAATPLLRDSWPLGAAPWGSELRAPAFTTLAVGLLVLTQLVASLWPTLTAWSRNLGRFLSVGERSTAAPTEGLLHSALVVFQIAASLTLVVCAGLLTVAFSHPHAAAGVGSGSVPALTLSRVELPGAGSAGGRSLLYQGLLERVRGVAGVVDTSLTTEGAWDGLGAADRVTALCVDCGIGSLPKQQTSGPSRIHAVSPGFFGSLRLRFLHGRDFVLDDDAPGERVAVVSRAFALQFFPGGDPVGKEVSVGDVPGEWHRVVGVVDDLPGRGLGSASPGEPVLYLSLLQHPPASARLLVRTSGEGADVHARVAATVARVGGVSLTEPTGLRGLLDRRMAPLRWFGLLFALAGMMVTGLALLGLHGAMAGDVRRRRREIGVRLAMGAEARGIVRLVVLRALRLAGLGMAIGLIPVSGVARMLQLRFDGVDPWNAGVTAGAALLLMLVAAVASLGPARSAARVEPAVALRSR